MTQQDQVTAHPHKNMINRRTAQQTYLAIIELILVIAPIIIDDDLYFKGF